MMKGKIEGFRYLWAVVSCNRILGRKEVAILYYVCSVGYERAAAQGEWNLCPHFPLCSCNSPDVRHLLSEKLITREWFDNAGDFYFRSQGAAEIWSKYDFGPAEMPEEEPENTVIRTEEKRMSPSARKKQILELMKDGKW